VFILVVAEEYEELLSGVSQHCNGIWKSGGRGKSGVFALLMAQNLLEIEARRSCKFTLVCTAEYMVGIEDHSAPSLSASLTSHCERVLCLSLFNA
jgi:hypothetical protein